MSPAFSLAAAAVAVLVLLPACAGSEMLQAQPEVPEQGLQATGRLAGARVAISSGEPDVLLGDCDPGDGPDSDLCVVGRTIDGLRVTLVVENPELLVAGQRLPVRLSDCEAVACDAVREHLVVDLRVEDRTTRASDGALDVRRADDRHAAELDLRFPGGDRLTGHFDVAPD